MHKDETWQTYYSNGEPIVGEGWPAELGNPEVTGSDKIVGVAIVFLYRISDRGGLEVLWQKRSEKIDRYPGDFDISAGGHINLGESLVDAAVREAYEEIGAEISKEDLELAALHSFNRNRLAWVYMVNWTGREDSFKFDDGEVSEVRWVPWAEVDEFRMKFAKEPLKRDAVVFDLFNEWFLRHGII
ncbi:MAG: NUDIX domain-containing protein [Candidatus Saccharibacteria bacterium]|nr:NUDIX domain-containing protein [Candidatus Saccharibacteria bacterium]